MNTKYLLALFLIVTSSAFANDEIIRPYRTTRIEGMGGVRLTTGLYDDNFYSNPARVTANPSFKLSILDLMFEVNPTSITTFNDVLQGGNNLPQKISNTDGQNNHVIVQTAFPAVYIPAKGDRKFAIAFGLFMSTQADIDLRQNYNLDPQTIADVGPAVTFGYKLLKDDALSIGATAHMDYRLMTKPGYSLFDFIRGTSLSPSNTGGQGTSIDFDIGATYDLPIKLMEDLKFSAAFAIDNVMGGRYNFGFRPIAAVTSLPIQQPRSIGFGGSATKGKIGAFKDTVVALEFTDFGNNANGSVFRQIHIGGETHFGLLAIRSGINQGYLCAGLGVDLIFFSLEAATYGEELSLNAGQLEDRRYSLRIGFHI